MSEILVITNSLGSGDYMKLVSYTRNRNGETIFEGHSISAFDLRLILDNLGYNAELVHITDEEMENYDE
jgi:hypothetical protein